MNEGSSTLLDDAIDSARQLGDIVVSARRLGGRLVGTMTDLVGDLGSRAARSVSTGTVACPSCRRPHVCWMPDERAPLTSTVSPCGTARVCFTVRNCGLATREVFVAATGADAGLVHGAPSTATIGALDEATLVAELALPQGTSEAHVILWVRGCEDTAVRWTVSGSGERASASHHLTIDDCPETQHHWHDHFAQPKDCRNRRRG